jgi:hypothetical protein
MERRSGLTLHFQSQFQTGKTPLLMKLALSEQLKQFPRVLQGAFFPTLALSMIRIEAPIASHSRLFRDIVERAVAVVLVERVAYRSVVVVVQA